MAYSIFYKEEAINDLKEIASFYSKISTTVALKFEKSLYEGEIRLKKYPYAFAATKYKKFRRILLSGFPYKMVYIIEDKNVTVFAVFHTARSNRFIKTKLK